MAGGGALGQWVTGEKGHFKNRGPLSNVLSGGRPKAAVHCQVIWIITAEGKSRGYQNSS